MKKRVSKELLLILILIPVLIFIAYSIGVRKEGSLPNFSVINKGKYGYSIFYESLKKLGYPVERSLGSIMVQPSDNAQLITYNSDVDINSQEVQDWIYKGGTLIYISDNPFKYISYGEMVEESMYYRIYEFNKGKLLIADVKPIMNINLAKNSSEGYEILKAIDSLSYEKLNFNEYYLFLGQETNSLWGATPIGVKLLLYQFILTLAAIYYFKGKGFGKPIPYYEEVEREENEYIYNTAFIYRRAGTYDIMVKAYYGQLLRSLRATPENFIGLWEQRELPNLKEAKRLQSLMKNFISYDFSKKDNRKKECLKIIYLIEELNIILLKRRGLKWKTTKAQE